ncbi:hypothetical protein P3H15_09985 [Rhodococcus sp. T2V]|uniref:hypothetical protein n=1 Tax=Rhodococcus sp. T2V TaxID=3034164 RepID=UPI0023E32777|nr:hypothetical protein [Rhodococcus sp. T2V]MDF3305349.1 hypothetical protein [Rhodococcus sp. T2V]
MADAAGRHALITQNSAAARKHFEHSLAVFRNGGNLLYMIRSLFGLALASDADGNRTRREECRREILALIESRGESVYRRWSLWRLRVGALQRDEHSHAKDLLTQALPLARSVDDRSSTGGAWKPSRGSLWMKELSGGLPS